MSVVPPAAKGTTIRMGLDGQASCAAAQGAEAAQAIAAAKASI